MKLKYKSFTVVKQKRALQFQIIKPSILLKKISSSNCLKIFYITTNLLSLLKIAFNWSHIYFAVLTIFFLNV